MRKNKLIQIIFYLTFIGIIVFLIPNNLLKTLLIIFFLFLIIKSKKVNKKESKKIPTVTKEKQEHYIKLGMTEKEIIFFRDTMNQTKQQIIQLQKNMNLSTKLKTINLRNDTLKVTKVLFKELVKEPQKIHSANHFLYTHLPNLVDLTTKYLEIDSHEVKTKQTYEKLEESAQIIDQVAKLIVKDYEEFISDDLNDLDLEISVAKNSIKVDNKAE